MYRCLKNPTTQRVKKRTAEPHLNVGCTGAWIADVDEEFTREVLSGKASTAVLSGRTALCVVPTSDDETSNACFNDVPFVDCSGLDGNPSSAAAVSTRKHQRSAGKLAHASFI